MRPKSRDDQVNAFSARQETSPRITINLQAQLIDCDGGHCEATILDLSSNGFRLRVNGDLFSGERVRLKVGKSQPVAAEIKWVRGDEAGGVFIEG